MKKFFKLVILFFIFFNFQTSSDSLLDKIGTPQIIFKFSFGDIDNFQFEGVSLGLIANTEADFSFGKDKNEFCCEREYTNESAHDMSEEESQRIVQRFLSSGDSQSPTPSFIPSSRPGQR